MTSPAHTPMRSLSIFGAGGHGREVAWLAQQLGWKPPALRFLVSLAELSGVEVDGMDVSLLDRQVSATAEDGYVVAIGNPHDRERCSALCEDAGFSAATLIHPQVLMGRVDVGAGSVVCGGTVITTNVVIGAHVHINIGCTVSHDVKIDDFATLSPGVHIAGRVHLGKRVFIGAGSVVIDGKPGEPLVIGDDAIIAAGSCVTRSVEAGAMVAGVPAERKR